MVILSKSLKKSDVFYTCVSEFTDNTCQELGDLHEDVQTFVIEYNTV